MFTIYCKISSSYFHPVSYTLLTVALETGAILEMQKALLDPRRPDVPTQEHR